MLEIVVGSLSLFFGWLCLDHVSRVRSRYSIHRSPRSRFDGGKPLMIVPSALGVLFVLDGVALLALAASARLRIADGLEDFVSLQTLLIFAPVAVTAAALIRMAASSRSGRSRSGREKSRGGPAMYSSPANTVGRTPPSQRRK